MENKKNKNLGLALIAIFISILSIFISILNFNGSKDIESYLLKENQVQEIQPIKHNKILSDTKDKLEFIDQIYINEHYSLIYDVSSFTNDDMATFSITVFNLFLHDYLNDIEYLIFDEVYDEFLFDYSNFLYFDFYLTQIDNLEFDFTSYIYLNNTEIEFVTNFDLPIDLYNYFLSNNYDLDNIEFDTNDYNFYFAQLFNNNDYNNTLFDNISLIATKVGAILVATLSPITTLLFSNGKLTIVGASLAMALGVGAIYLIFRMVRGLIKQNDRG